LSAKHFENAPNGWEFARLIEVASLVRGVNYKREDALQFPAKDFLPILRATNITGKALTFENLTYVPKKNISSNQLLIPGDVVIASSSGSKEIVGKSGQFLEKLFVGSFGAFCTGIRADKLINGEYFGLYFQSPVYRAMMSGIAAGSNINNIKSSELIEHILPIAPYNEQIRIVAKLAELLPELDAGLAELKAAQKKLTQYRQSLLKAAVEGALTAEWRKSNPPTETGAQLLERILVERRARWEAKQLAKFKEQGKAPPKDWQSKYPAPVKPELTGLPELPEGWVWASLDAVIDDGPQNGLYLPAKQYGRGIPILRIDDFQVGWHRPRGDLNLVEASQSDASLYALCVDDLIVNRVNSMTHLGKSLIVKTELQGVLYESNMMRFSLQRGVEAAFVSFYLGSELGRKRLNVDAKWAVNQASINQQDVKRTPIPLCSIVEQKVVMQHLSIHIASLTEQVIQIEKAFVALQLQRKNILKSAFSGKLVPQDPSDEPASALLARIRANRGDSASHVKSRKASQAIPTVA
jgi:type I restriction enzyme, S subunit